LKLHVFEERTRIYLPFVTSQLHPSR